MCSRRSAIVDDESRSHADPDLNQTQTLVTLATAFAILQLRTTHSVFFALGATAAALIAKALKHIIKQPRPDSTTKLTYGMPSTHSASIGFMGTYLVLSSLLLLPHPRLKLHRVAIGSFEEPSSWTLAHRTASCLLFGTLAYSVWWSRVKLGHHTTAQVVAGGMLGCTIALLAFVEWQGQDWLQEQGLAVPEAMRSLLTASGWKVFGSHLERIAEDAAFAGLEAYEKRDAHLLWQAVTGAWESVIELVQT